MKLLFLIIVILSAAFAKPVVTKVERFECIANYLKEKHIIDETFEYYVQTEVLDCSPYIKSLREKYLNEVINDTDSSSSEEDAQLNAQIAQNKACFAEQLSALDYPEKKMQKYIYKKSSKLYKTEKKRLAGAVEADIRKIMTLAASTCTV